MSEHSKFLLADSQIPTAWINVLPSLPEPLAPPLNPQTEAPLGPQDLLPLFPMEVIEAVAQGGRLSECQSDYPVQPVSLPGQPGIAKSFGEH